MTCIEPLTRRLAVLVLALTVPYGFAAAQPAAPSAAPAQPQAADKPAKPQAEDYKPQEGQEGKDVIWIPSALAMVEKMLDVAGVTPQDFVVDLGSGDGRTVITAAKRGARALGVEYNPKMVELSRRNAEKEGVSERASFVQGDLFEVDFSQATVVTLFLLPEINLALRPKILAMKPGTRVVSNSFDMGDWPADQTFHGGPKCQRYCNGYFWVVPARVEGTWKLPEGELTLRQRYQMLSGTLRSGNRRIRISGRMHGEEISFVAGRLEYRGKVSGDTITGTARPVGKEIEWRATRSADKPPRRRGGKG